MAPTAGLRSAAITVVSSANFQLHGSPAERRMFCIDANCPRLTGDAAHINRAQAAGSGQAKRIVTHQGCRTIDAQKNRAFHGGAWHPETIHRSESQPCAVGSVGLQDLVVALEPQPIRRPVCGKRAREKLNASDVSVDAQVGLSSQMSVESDKERWMQKMRKAIAIRMNDEMTCAADEDFQPVAVREDRCSAG